VKVWKGLFYSFRKEALYKKSLSNATGYVTIFTIQTGKRRSNGETVEEDSCNEPLNNQASKRVRSDRSV
jgi:hypothetical protein